jgi:hypothetical protein
VDLYADIRERYGDHYTAITRLSNAFEHIKPITPRTLQARLMKSSVDLDAIIESLQIRDAPSPHYHSALVNIMRRMPQKTLMELFRFWFGTERPDIDFYGGVWLEFAPPVRDQHLAWSANQIHAYTCSYTMRVPRMADESSVAVLEPPLEGLLELALQNQRLADSAGLHFQLL